MKSRGSSTLSYIICKTPLPTLKNVDLEKTNPESQEICLRTLAEQELYREQE